jgi:hypothetical protein
MTQPPDLSVQPLDVYTFSYSNTHTVTVINDIWTWSLGTPKHGNTFTLSATLDAALGQNYHCDVIEQDGPSPGSVLCSVTFVAGSTSASNSTCTAFPSAATQFYFRSGPTANWTSAPTLTTTMSITWTNAPPLPACAYGAQPNPSAAIYTVITDALVTAVAAALGMGALGLLALSTMIGAPVVFPTCNNIPTMPSALVDGDFIDGTGLPNPFSITKWMSHVTYGIWLFYCQCKPAPTGNPPPVNPPVPVLPPRLQPGPQPTPPCSNTDVCSTLNVIIRLMTAINIQVNNNSYAAVSSGYILGTSHAGLSGNGELAVSAILGAFVSFTTLPNRIGILVSDPNVLYDVGFISFGTPEGWYPPNTIDHNPWLVLPNFMTNVTKIGYSIPSDVVLTLTELKPAQLQSTAVAGT